MATDHGPGRPVTVDLNVTEVCAAPSSGVLLGRVDLSLEPLLAGRRPAVSADHFVPGEFIKYSTVRIARTKPAFVPSIRRTAGESDYFLDQSPPHKHINIYPNIIV